MLNARRWEQNGEPNTQPSHDGDSTGDVIAEARFRVEGFGLRPAGHRDHPGKGLMRAVPVRAPASGIVIRKEAVAGGYVRRGAAVHHRRSGHGVGPGRPAGGDLRHVTVGQEAAVIAARLPG